MARKKIEPIETLGSNDDKLLVSKSIPLYSLWQSNMTLAEFKILDIYLARIDSRNKNKRTVIFGKGELEEKLGVKKIDTPILKQRLKNLMNPVEIKDKRVKGNKKIKLVTLFEECEAEQDKNEQWTVKMTCTDSAVKYFFNVEELGYLRYKLRCITSLSSRYTYIMFLYLEANRFRKSWEIDLEELKKILACDKEEYAKEFKYFNRDVLKRVQKEMHEKTECRYTYEPVRNGRTVTGIRFEVETLKPKLIEEDPNQMTMDEYLEREAIDEELKKPLWEQALPRDWFTEQEVDLLRNLLYQFHESQLPPRVNSWEGIEIQREKYISEKVSLVKVYDSRKPIKNKFAYMRKLMEEDLG